MSLNSPHQLPSCSGPRAAYRPQSLTSQCTHTHVTTATSHNSLVLRAHDHHPLPQRTLGLRHLKMSAFESAIDDSFDPIPQPLPDEEYTDDSFFDNAYQGPRDGHWDVSSSVGSFIDDRTPTVYGYHNKPYGTGHRLHIDEGLAKRLMQATIEDKRTAAIAAAKPPPSADQSSDRVKKSSALSEAKTPKPFFVPPLRDRPYNPVVPDLPESADNGPAPPVAESTRSERKPYKTSSSSKGSTRPTPSRTAAQTNIASDIPESSPSTSRTIRILGKNGEEAFVNLPSLPTMYPQATSSVRKSATEQPAKSSKTSLNHEEQSHSSYPNFVIDNKETNMISETRAPASKEQTPSPVDEWAAISAAASCKDSGIVYGGMSAVASNVGSGQAASNKSGSAISRGVFSTAQNIAKLASTPNRKTSSVQAESLPPPFNEVGMGVTTGFPAQKAQSEQSNWMASFGGSGSGKTSQGSARNDAPSVRSSRRRGEKVTAHSNYKPPTVRSDSRSVSTSCHDFGTKRASQHTVRGHATSSRTSHERSKQDSAHSSFKPPTVRSTSGPVHASYSGFGSEMSSRSVGDDAPFAKSAHHRYNEEEARSNHKPPTVHSTSSSSSVSHAFGGFQHHDTIKKAQIQSARLDGRRSSVHSRSTRLGAAKDTVYASNSSRAKAAPSVTPLARPEVHLDTSAPVSPLSDGTSPICPSHSPVSPLAQSPHVLHTGYQQTRFAGDGWISPHPLSVATSDIGAPPQSAVYVPTDGLGHRGPLTYSEWIAQRDAAKSISGSFVGSHVPSALEPHIVPSAAYNYPPPTSFFGSYELQTRQFHQLRTRDNPNMGRRNQHGYQATERRASNDAVFSQGLGQSYHDQRPAHHSHTQSHSSRHNDSVYGGSVHQTPSVRARNADCNSTSQHNDSASGSGQTSVSGYNMGLTPTELAQYHRQLSNTISHHSSQLSHMEQEQESPQPDYNVWNSSHSRASRREVSHRSALSHHSAQAFPPNLSYPREKTQMEMPWDHESSHRSPSSPSASSRSRRTRSQTQRQSPANSGSQFTTREREGASTIMPSHVSDNRSRVSAMSQARSNVPQSHATYGSEGWQDLENAEHGRGRFQSRYDW